MVSTRGLAVGTTWNLEVNGKYKCGKPKRPETSNNVKSNLRKKIFLKNKINLKQLTATVLKQDQNTQKVILTTQNKTCVNLR